METQKTKQFFIRFESSSGSLAVEKHLHGYVRQNFADHLVDEDAIERIVKDIESEQERYFQTHRGQKVEISVYNNGCTDGKFIHIGQMCAVLVLVKGHYVSNPCRSNENLQGTASSWHKVSEELPKEKRYKENTLQGIREWTESNTVLVIDNHYLKTVDCLKNGKWMKLQTCPKDCDGFPIQYLYWMDIPKPPKED